MFMAAYEICTHNSKTEGIVRYYLLVINEISWLVLEDLDKLISYNTHWIVIIENIKLL